MAENSGMLIGEGALERTSAIIDEAKGKLNQRLGTLEGDLAHIGQSWQGSAATAFTQLMVQWQDSAHRTTSALDEFVDKLSGASRTFARKEDDVAQDFSGYQAAL